MYDLETGILLSNNRRVGPEDGRRTLSDSQFVSIRRVVLPWAGEAPPAWAAAARTTRGEGTSSTAMQGVPTLAVGLSLQGTVTGRGPRWLRYDATATRQNLNGMPATSSSGTQVSGNAQTMGLWIPPKGAAALKPGQELDRDPTTGFRQFVAGTDGRFVDVRETGPAHQLDGVYDVVTGRLVRFRRSQQVGLATMTNDLAITIE